MCYLSLKLAVALITFTLGVSVATVWIIKHSSTAIVQQKIGIASTQQEKRELRLDIPKDIWEPIFFKSINERARVANLSNLREVTLPSDDLEVRVWAGFGLTTLEGFNLKRTDGQWSAIHLEGISARLPRSEYQRTLQAPESGWETCWKRLVDAGIATLPDAEAIHCNPHINDGFSYVVEFNMNKTYQTYMYENPDAAKCSEAKQMMNISEIIAEEFGLEEFKIKE
jgi:hypothetical protein